MKPESKLLHVKTIFLSRLESFITQNLSNTTLHANDASMFMAISKSTLNRKLKLYQGTTINQFIHSIRLKKAMVLLSLGYKVSEVASRVGYKTPSYFAKNFKTRYQKPPSSFKT